MKYVSIAKSRAGSASRKRGKKSASKPTPDTSATAAASNTDSGGESASKPEEA